MAAAAAEVVYGYCPGAGRTDGRIGTPSYLRNGRSEAHIKERQRPYNTRVLRLSRRAHNEGQLRSGECDERSQIWPPRCHCCNIGVIMVVNDPNRPGSRVAYALSIGIINDTRALRRRKPRSQLWKICSLNLDSSRLNVHFFIFSAYEKKAS